MPNLQELVKRLNDWQGGSNNKQAKAESLKDAIRHANLEPYCLTFRGPCFRKIDLTKGSGFQLGQHLYLLEQVSSWTRNQEIAKQFKKGPSKVDGLISCILRHTPEEKEVILNLPALYKEIPFQAAVAACNQEDTRYIQLYGSSQEEIILEVPQVPMQEVFSLGGYIGTEEQITMLKNEKEFAHLGLTVELIAEGLKKIGKKPGDPWWLSPENAQAVLTRSFDKCRRLGILRNHILE